MRVIISGGGTGGHIFPAISIANAVKTLRPDAEILFVGALGRMEMERVPAAGYSIVGLPIMGFPRKPGLSTFKFFANLFKSLNKARNIIKDFKPQVAVGVGGYASGPVLRVAASKRIPCLIQEQNSYAGLTNRLLAKKVKSVCVAYDNMERYFPASKIVLTGNPVRSSLSESKGRKTEARQSMGLGSEKPVLLIVGGSLGARTLNNSVLAHVNELKNSNIEVVWQTGKYYFAEIKKQMESVDAPNIHIQEFISNMDWAYAAADLVISRAGAGSISELCLMEKPVILVPSPNVSEDHQTKNAMALVSKQAADFVADNQAVEVLIPRALKLIQNEEELRKLSSSIGLLAKPNAAMDIAKQVIALAEKTK
jgi:UDP-N-acetylglucosamine--N-acetylmuramyl-(pentapeptide) pyrophosphoryl-undecaprenol N-acetylglucosamine transferase